MNTKTQIITAAQKPKPYFQIQHIYSYLLTLDVVRCTYLLTYC